MQLRSLCCISMCLLSQYGLQLPRQYSFTNKHTEREREREREREEINWAAKLQCVSAIDLHRGLPWGLCGCHYHCVGRSTWPEHPLAWMETVVLKRHWTLGLREAQVDEGSARGSLTVLGSI
ncbi:hypothetical protein HDV57DRAFT_480865 [Trichoderma longibrachiatum]